MKKVSKILMSLLFCFAIAFTIAGCGKSVKITAATVKNGTLATTIVVGSTLDTSKVVVRYKYDNNTSKDVPASELEFSTVDTSSAGTKKLTITYAAEDYDFDVSINVVASEADVNSIDQLESALLNAFNAKRTSNVSEESSFMNPDEPLYVGDDNRFDFRIVASGEDPLGNEVDNLKKVRTVVTVELINGNGTYTVLEGDDLTAMVAINTEDTELDFTDAAVGKQFRVTVKAANANPDYEEYTYFVADKIEVVDGYNVYNAAELSLYDNLGARNWAKFKEEHGLTGITTNGIILQNDISVGRDDVPEDVFWSESSPNYSTVKSKVPADCNFVGTPIDDAGRGLYERDIANGQQFKFIGNYFKLDLSSFPKMVIERTDCASESPIGLGYVGEGSYITSHLTTFFNRARGTITDNKTSLEYKNINFFGNGALNTEEENSGAIILMKAQYVKTNVKNTVMNNFYVGYIFELGNEITVEKGSSNYNPNIGEYKVEQCKGFYAYQCFFYVWGAEHLIIKDSVFKHAGGPAIIGDHAEIQGSDHHTGYPAQIDVISSEIESQVVPTSVWFANYGMSQQVATITQAEQLYNGDVLPATGRSIIVDTAEDGYTPVLNIVALFKAGALSFDPKPSQGYIRFFDSETDYNKHYGLNNEEQQTMTYGLDMMSTTKQFNGMNFCELAIATGSNILESSGNGGFINDNVATNYITSAVGTLKAMGVYGAVAANLNAFGLTEMPEIFANFTTLTLEQQKAAIINFFTAAPNAAIGIYMGDNKHALFDEISDFAAGAADVANIINQVRNWADKSYAEGEFVNLYIGSLGMGAVLGLK